MVAARLASDRPGSIVSTFIASITVKVCDIDGKFSVVNEKCSYCVHQFASSTPRHTLASNLVTAIPNFIHQIILSNQLMADNERKVTASKW